MVASLFKNYEALAASADLAFREMRSQYPSCVTCEPLCSDCCHAVFGLFLIEAAYVRSHFENLTRKERRRIVSRAAKAENEMGRVIDAAQRGEGPQGSFSLEKARVRCPLLNVANECVLYQHRPITCRVYGVPTAIQGKAHVCWKAKFNKEKTYAVFNLDEANRKLYHLSMEFLKGAGGNDPLKAGFLVSVSKVVTTRTEDLIRQNFL
jgi:Fe-S-cluster containining protein